MTLFHPPLPADLVTFNVRGHVFQTTLTTLRRFSESVLYKMVEYEQQRDRATSAGESYDAFFIDRDPDLFAAILRYHDTDEYVGAALSTAGNEASTSCTCAVTPEALLLEAQYYNIQSLEEKITSKQSSFVKYPIKYECCSIIPGHLGSFAYSKAHLSSVPISEDAVKTYSFDHALNSLEFGDRDLIETIQEVVNKKNRQNSGNGYNWTLSAAVTAKQDQNYGAMIILKGEKI
jgi:hypothetical protein